MSLSSSLPAAHVKVEGVSKSFAARRVLTDISFTVPAGARLGLIGENGSGKSTLLQIIAGLLPPDSGVVEAALPGAAMAARIGLLHQQPPFSAEDSIEEAIESSIVRHRQAAAAVDSAAAAMAEQPEASWAIDDYAAALDLAERLGAWSIETHVEQTIAGLGLAGIPRDRRVSRLSGGQQARLSLAWLLLNAPDVLLLDEPTNHLDDAAREFLQRTLFSWRGPILIASHDRAFIDETVTSLIDLDPTPMPHARTAGLIEDGSGTGIGVQRFTGNYSDYLVHREQSRTRWELQYRDEQAQLARLRAGVKDNQTVAHSDWTPRTESKIAQKFYSDRNAKVVSRRVNDTRSRLEELERTQIRKPPAILEFRGLTTGLTGSRTAAPGLRGQGPLLTAAEVEVSGRLAATDLSIGAGERWMITGANGAGKSTLLGVLAGRIHPDQGAVHRPAGVTVGLLEQDVVLPDPHLRGPARSARQVYQDAVGEAVAARVPLSTFGLLAGRDENQALSSLSVGQMRRLALAIVLSSPPEILLLDEPSNHFSLPLVEALESALGDYPGAVVVATHDTWLRRNWTGEHLELGSQAPADPSHGGRRLEGSSERSTP